MPKHARPIRLGLLVASPVACVALAACGSNSSGTTVSAVTPAPVTVTATQTVAAHVKAAVRRHTAEHVTRTKPARKTKTAAASSMWTMPNELGRVLQKAQDDLQRVSGDPVFFSHSHDLLGDRFQILDSDWKVCTQNVAAGTKIGQLAHVDFGVVKSSEQCP